jgi:hypothetical protein
MAASAAVPAAANLCSQHETDRCCDSCKLVRNRQTKPAMSQDARAPQNCVFTQTWPGQPLPFDPVKIGLNVLSVTECAPLSVCLCSTATATHAGSQSRMPPLHSWPAAALPLGSSSCPPVNKHQTGLCPVSAHQPSDDKQRGSWGAARAVLGWSTAQGSRKEAKTQVGIYSLPDLCTARSVQNKTKKVQPAC